MFIDRINLNHLRIFEVVYRTRSMTQAASEMHLTQSGVSQHMQALEEALDAKLFDRIKQRIFPTGAADSLYLQCKKSFHELERGLLEITENKEKIEGTIRIGIPLEFGHDIVLPLLGKLQKQYQGLTIKIEVGLAPRMNELILAGNLDFAFVDELIHDKRFKTEKVYNEDLELCISQEYLKLKNIQSTTQNRKIFETLEYVEYEGGEPLLRSWFQHHLQSRSMNFKVRSYVEDAYCLSSLVIAGLGAGILPGSLLHKLKNENNQKLIAFRGCGRPMKSAISIASIRERTHSPALLLVMNFLKSEISKLSNRS